MSQVKYQVPFHALVLLRVNHPLHHYTTQPVLRLVVFLPDSGAAYHRSVWDDYEADTELIGRGAFARVFRAIKREDGSPVAIKVIGRETKAFAQQRRGEQAVAR